MLAVTVLLTLGLMGAAVALASMRRATLGWKLAPHRVDAMDHMLKRGRSAHRAWIEQVFDPWLPAHGVPDREALVMAFYAATDVMQWKLLRRDFDLTATLAEQIIRRLVEGVICSIDRNQEENT